MGLPVRVTRMRAGFCSDSTKGKNQSWKNATNFLNLTELTHLPALQDMLIEYCKAHKLTSLNMENILCVLFCTMAIRNEKHIEETLQHVKYEYEYGVESYAKFQRSLPA